MPTSSISIEQFSTISEALLGETALDQQLAAEYLERVAAAPEGSALPRLAAELAAILSQGGDPAAAIKAQILGDDQLRALCEVIILLWYLGEIHGQAPTGGHPEHYFRGLFWRVVHAHPPALSGGYSGYWAYPPEN
jgi:hypothetical protein